MTYYSGNSVCNGVTNAVRGCVQNQSQNQTVVKTAFGSVVAIDPKAKSVTREDWTWR